jgi:hypothetical protein
MGFAYYASWQLAWLPAGNCGSTAHPLCVIAQDHPIVDDVKVTLDYDLTAPLAAPRWVAEWMASRCHGLLCPLQRATVALRRAGGGEACTESSSLTQLVCRTMPGQHARRLMRMAVPECMTQPRRSRP